MTAEREVKSQAAMQPSGHEQGELATFTVRGPQHPHHAMVFGRVVVELMRKARCNGVPDEQQRNAETQQDAKKIGRRHAQRSAPIYRDEREREVGRGRTVEQHRTGHALPDAHPQRKTAFCHVNRDETERVIDKVRGHVDEEHEA